MISRRHPDCGWESFALVPLILLLAFTPQGNTMMQSLQGFMPGSGGDQDSDPFSRGGVNDGEALVAGKDQIRSFAPIEDAPFADSDQPSLFDVVNDQFDEPVRKMKDFDKSIALPPSLMAEVNQRLAKSKQAAREFSTLRRNSEGKQQRIKDLPSKALFYVWVESRCIFEWKCMTSMMASTGTRKPRIRSGTVWQYRLWAVVPGCEFPVAIDRWACFATQKLMPSRWSTSEPT